MVSSHGRATGAPALHAANLVVNIAARPYAARTFVYMDGGRELGIAPLRVQFDRSGRHRLLFFAPSLGVHGRVTKVIDVRPRSRRWVSVTLGPSREVARRIND
jgi:hypothetical protein